ncbi:hypothetical protein WDW37_06225 [Bdellovibrionota bacterium FG-1]
MNKIGYGTLALNLLLLVTPHFMPFAHAAPPVELTQPTAVHAIKIENLPPGKFLHAFYVAGHETFMPLVGSVLEIAYILKAVDHIQIPDSGIVTLDETKVPKVKYSNKSFSYLVLAITGPLPSQLFFKNIDDNHLVIDPRATPEDLKKKPKMEFSSEKIGFIDAFKLKSKLPPGGSTIVIDASNSSKDLK